MGGPHEEWLLLVEGKEAESGILHEGPQTTCFCHCWQVGGAGGHLLHMEISTLILFR